MAALLADSAGTGSGDSASSEELVHNIKMANLLQRHKSSVDEMALSNPEAPIEDMATAAERARKLALQRSGLGGTKSASRAQRKQGFLMKRGPLKVINAL